MYHLDPIQEGLVKNKLPLNRTWQEITEAYTLIAECGRQETETRTDWVALRIALLLKDQPFESETEMVGYILGFPPPPILAPWATENKCYIQLCVLAFAKCKDAGKGQIISSTSLQKRESLAHSAGKKILRSSTKISWWVSGSYWISAMCIGWHGNK